jgi:hypothetical protein
MDTDAHGSTTKDLSVSIRVNPWLKLGLSASWLAWEVVSPQLSVVSLEAMNE